MTPPPLTPQEQAIVQQVEDSFDDQINWLERLVNQPSHTLAVEDVEQAAAIIDEFANQLGLRRELFQDPSGRFADHRIFSTPSVREDDSALALVGHCDTVYPRSQGFLEFRRDSTDGPSSGDHVFGPGVLDMKSGLTVALFGLRALAKAAPEVYDRLKVRFFCNTDEELGSPSSWRMFEEWAPRISRALVFEGGRDEDRIITARKGTGGFRLKAIGHAAHAGNEHANGINAVHALAVAIPHIESLTDYEQGTTVNVGVISGGTAKNTVPENAECHIDVRVSKRSQMKRVEEHLRQVADWQFPGADDLPPRVRKAELRLDGQIRRPPMETTPESEALRKEYEVFAHKLGLGTGPAPMQGGGSDANNLAGFGIPTIDGLGPYGKFMHSPKEWCSLSSLRKRTATLACFLASMEPQ